MCEADFGVVYICVWLSSHFWFLLHIEASSFVRRLVVCVCVCCTCCVYLISILFFIFVCVPVDLCLNVVHPMCIPFKFVDSVIVCCSKMFLWFVMYCSKMFIRCVTYCS